jgi:hypothetical protein
MSTPKVDLHHGEWGEIKMGNVDGFIERAKGMRACALELFDQRALKAAATGQTIPWSTYVAEAVDAAIAGTLDIVSNCGLEAITEVECIIGDDEQPKVNIAFSDQLGKMYFEAVGS